MLVKNFNRIGSALSAAGLLLLAACGGGGGGGGGGATESAATTSSSSASSVSNSAASASSASSAGSSSSIATVSASLAVACDRSTDANCAATSATQYAGSGIGVWSATGGSNAAKLSVNLSGVSGKTVTLIWTNTSTAAQSGIASTANVVAGDSSAAARLREIQSATQATTDATLDASRSGRLAGVMASSVPTVSAAYVAGDSRSWYEVINATTLTTTLRKQVSLSTGQMLNIWVPDSEWTTSSASYKVTQSQVDALAAKFARTGTGIFDIATTVAGAPWGATGSSALIASAQDVNIVVTNFVSDNTAGGLVGYFYELNNYTKGTGVFANSNEALVFFIDSETLASSSASAQDLMASVLAHEFTHMINFYQRKVLKGVRFETWLEEVSAMMMEDIVNPQIVTSYNDIRDSRLPGWLASGINNCSLTVYNDSTSDSCFSYSIGGAYGAYLLRQYGLGFYQSLLQGTSSSAVTALDTAIKASDSTASFATSVKRWGAAIALLDASVLPTGYGYPAKAVTVGSNSWSLPALSGPSDASVRKISSSLPGSLKAYAHAAQTFSASGSTFTRTVTIPANTTLTVVVN